MPRPVLMVSQFADPCLVGGNNNVYRQARALQQALGLELEVLTWPEGDSWSGPIPPAVPTEGWSSLTASLRGLKYDIVRLPLPLIERVVRERDWRYAVDLGCELLEQIDPSVVHLQHWRGLWWILESAHRLSIPTVYTAHDWGLGCLRTILVKGEGGLCDGIVEREKCLACIWSGRNLVGRVNELLVSNALGEQAIQVLDHGVLRKWLSSRGAVRLGLRKRLDMHLQRSRECLERTGAVIVPSTFARRFFGQLGVPEDRIHVEPWYYDPPAGDARPHIAGERIVLGYVGRISPEKGLHRLFDALSRGTVNEPIHLVVAGAIEGRYAESLQRAFARNVERHSVEWMGWIAHEDIGKFYERVDGVCLPSEWMDNTPLALLESFAFRRPVVISDLPSVADLVQDGRNAIVVEFGSTASLASGIRRVAAREVDLRELAANIPPVRSSVSYARAIKVIYDSVTAASGDG
jgi:glycosyltransferase involved in cell wall biosynthesis